MQEMTRKLAVFAKCVVLAGAWMALAEAARGQVEAAPAGSPAGDDAAARATIESVRTIGKALFGWVSAQPRDESAAAAPSEEAVRVDWSQCPAISHAEAVALLVPTYVASLPATNGWGHPFELCLRRPVPGRGQMVMGVRSPGRDGRFENADYAVGAFSPEEHDRDVVWLDGYFMTWPQKQE
jgi:hypothetical protein